MAARLMSGEFLLLEVLLPFRLILFLRKFKYLFAIQPVYPAVMKEE